MAKVILIGLEHSTATQIGRALSEHDVQEKPKNTSLREIADADIVFADGERKQYLPLLNDLRKQKPGMPFVVVTRIPETTDWLDALEAGATDYCAAPFEPRHMSWLMESALPERRTFAAA